MHRVGLRAGPDHERGQPRDLELLAQVGAHVLVDPLKRVVGRELAEPQRRLRAVRAPLAAKLHDDGPANLWGERLQRIEAAAARQAREIAKVEQFIEVIQEMLSILYRLQPRFQR